MIIRYNSQKPCLEVGVRPITTILSLALSMFLAAPYGLAQDLLWQTLMDSADKSIAAHNYKHAESQLTAALKSIEIDAKNKNDQNIRTTLQKLAAVYDAQDQHQQAELILNKLIALDQKKSMSSIEFANDLNSLGVVHRHQGKTADAERVFKQAISIFEKTNAKDAGDSLPNVLSNLAMLYQDTGKYAEQEEVLKRALSLSQNSPTANVNQTATIIEQLAKLYTVQNRLSEAEPLLQKSLSLKEKALGQGNPQLAQSLTELGKLHQSQGDYEQSEKFFKRALALVERERGSDHYEVATALINLGDLYRAQNKNGQAIPLYEKAISICETATGKDSCATAHAITKLAEAYMENDKYARAEALFKRALVIEEKAYGQDSREAAKSLSNLALLYMQQGRYQDADPLYKKSLANVQQHVGNQHPDTAACLNNLAWLYKNEGKLTEAESLIKRGLEIRKQSLGAAHPAFARNLANLAEIYAAKKEWTQAESLLRTAIEIEKHALDSDHPDIAANMRDLAGVLAAQEKWSEVETTYKELLKLDAATNVSESVTASDLDGLVKALTAQGKKEEAKPLASRSVYIKEKLPGAVVATASDADATIATMTAASQSTSRPIKDKWALVVGISNFQDPSMNLKYAAKDATDFRNYLIQDAHFKSDHVKLLTDKEATRQNIVNHIGEKWLKRIANSDDLVVIYLSTHGSSAKQEAGSANFIVPHDGNLENIVLNGIPMQWLTAGIKDLVHSDRIVLVLDVCHGGAVGDGAKGLRRGETEFDPSKVSVGEGQVIVASSQADQISWESKKYPNGVFTRRLLEGLRKNGEKTGLRDAFQFMKERVEEEVLRDRAHLQTPVLVTKWWQGDDVVLAAPATAPRQGLESSEIKAVAPVSRSPVSSKNLNLKTTAKRTVRTK